MTTTLDTCCAEYDRVAAISRRRLLGGVAAAAATGAVTSVFGDTVRQTAFGATTNGNVLVVISLRGGNDEAAGGAGRDVICGGRGPDELRGGRRRDVCIGGPGRDTAQGCEVLRRIP